MKKSLTQTVGEGLIFSSVSTVVLKVLGLATIFVILRHLSVYEYGLVELILTIVTTFNIFSLPGFNTVVVSDMSIEKGKNELGRMRALFEAFFRFQLILSVMTWAILFFGADIIAHFYTGNIGILIKIASLTFLISPIRIAIQILFSVHLRFFEQALSSILEEIFKFCFIVILFFVFEMHSAGLLLAIVLSQLCVAFAMLPKALSVYGEFRHVDIREPVSILAFIRSHTKWSIFSSYLGSFTQNMRLWFIKFFFGTEAVGLYAVAEGFLGHTAALLPLGSVLSSVIPRYVSQEVLFKKIINKGLKYELLGLVFLGLFAALVFPPVIVYLFPQYASAMPLFQLMLLSLVPLAFGAIFTPVFFALRAQRSFFFSVVFKALLVAITMPVLLWSVGLEGAALELTLTAGILVIDRYRALKKLIPGFSLSLRDLIFMDEYDQLILRGLLKSIKRGENKF